MTEIEIVARCSQKASGARGKFRGNSVLAGNFDHMTKNKNILETSKT